MISAGLARNCRFFVEPRPGSGRAIGAVDRLGFLGSWLFRCEDPDHEGCDFLGLSRHNRDFSMGYVGFSAKKISRALLPLGRRRRARSRYYYDTETQYDPLSKPNSFSAFLNSIAVDGNCRFFVEPLTGRFRGLSVIALNPQLDGKSLNGYSQSVTVIHRNRRNVGLSRVHGQSAGLRAVWRNL